jgi:hypothetical protein
MLKRELFVCVENAAQSIQVAEQRIEFKHRKG